MVIFMKYELGKPVEVKTEEQVKVFKESFQNPKIIHINKYDKIYGNRHDAHRIANMIKKKAGR